MITMIETVLRDDLIGGWQEKMTAIIQSYGHNLKKDEAMLRKVRADTARCPWPAECLVLAFVCPDGPASTAGVIQDG